MSKGYTKFLAAGGKGEWLDDFSSEVRLGHAIGSRSMGRRLMKGEIFTIKSGEVRYVKSDIHALCIDRATFRYFDTHEEAKGARMLRGLESPWNSLPKGKIFND